MAEQRVIAIDLDNISTTLTSDTLIRQGESKASRLEITLNEEFTGFDYVLVFQINDNIPYSASVTPSEGILSFELSNTVTFDSGYLKVELQAFNVDDEILIKTCVFTFKIKMSVEGTPIDIPISDYTAYIQLVEYYMNKDIYDPQGIVSDAFDMDNMTDGVDKVAMLVSERIKLNELSTGGNSAYANQIDAPPIDPNIIDDEFDGDSLDDKWIWVNQGLSSVLVDNSIIELTAENQDNGVDCRGIIQPAPDSIDFTIVTKFLGTNLWKDYSKTGILISESPTGKQLGIWHAYDGSWKGLMGEFFATPATRGAYTYYGTPVQAQGGYIKTRIYKVGEIWYVDFYYSLNGYVWITSKIGLEIGFTPNYVGLGWDFETAEVGKSYFDWFRVTIYNIGL